MTSSVKHLVLSGGGTLIFQTIGIIQYLEEKNIYSKKDLTSIYGTSSGAIVGLFICLDYDWNIINKFMVERPWDNLFYIDSERIYNGFKQCGLYNKDIFVKSYKSLFEAKDISIEITMKEFYEHTNIDFHLISYDVNNLKMEDISHETYPDIKVLDAIHMTSSLPLFFKPAFIKDKCFIDGAIVLNYPLNLCIEKYNNKNEILGIKHIYTKINKNITSQTSVFEYFINIFYKLVKNISIKDVDDDDNNNIKHEIICDENYMTIKSIITTLTSSIERKNILEKGIKIATEYCNSIKLQD